MMSTLVIINHSFILPIKMADDIATKKQVSIRGHRNDIATSTGGGNNSHRSDIDTGVDSIIATCRGDSYYHLIAS